MSHYQFLVRKPDAAAPILLDGDWPGGYVEAEFTNEYPDVHGGLTFSGARHEADHPSRGICHVPNPGEPDHLWWLGFDCAHCDDASPLDYVYARDRGYPFSPVYGTYKPLGYVKAECTKLAAQFSA